MHRQFAQNRGNVKKNAIARNTFFDGPQIHDFNMSILVRSERNFYHDTGNFRHNELGTFNFKTRQKNLIKIVGLNWAL